MPKPPPIKLTDPLPDDSERDSKLGAYIRAWDAVQIQLIPLLCKLLGAHQNAVLILLSADMKQPTLRSICEALAKLRLGSKDQTAFNSLLLRWSRASYKRNRIVHGQWMLNVKATPKEGGGYSTKAVWVRFYAPVDGTLMNEIFGANSQKVRSKHVWNITEIGQSTTDLFTLASDLERFHTRMKLRPFVDPQPIELPQ